MFKDDYKCPSELAKLIEVSSNEIYIVDFETLDYLYVNQGACKALGYSQDELLSKTILDINEDLSLEEATDLKNILLKNGRLVNRSVHTKKDGSSYHVQAFIHLFKYSDIDAFVIFDTDISDLIRTEKLLEEETKKLVHQAHHDVLTNLPNRVLFQDRLSQSIIYAKRHKSEFALLFIDLDQFKKINDTLGHHIGDKVLVEASSRFENSIREEDTLARLGGDEFIIILKNITSIQDISHIAYKIIQSIKKPIEIDGTNLFISSSIGISLYPQDSEDENDLLKFADTAMYKAKDEGRDNYQFYSSDMTTSAFENVIMENSLRVAIREEQFIVYFQAQYDASNETLVGMEALVRWKYPEIGLVPPGKFIPIAEENGLIIDIDTIVMIQAMKQYVKWYENGFNPGKLALNLAMKQLAKENFIEELLDTMHGLNFKAEWLALEVTEGQVMNNPNASIEKLNEISSMGIELALDDFGTGYSSLSYLKKLPLNKLKIDQSFVRDIITDEDDAAITKAIIALGQNLNLKLIAEGVETKEQKEFLLENGCTLIQGYLYSKPIPAEEVTPMLNKY
ncbi:MAG: EAL domain-containing protein [Campylobacterota bacterium]|nr:EAL domain-containing protein [Campylobacterota bacterium]